MNKKQDDCYVEPFNEEDFSENPIIQEAIANIGEPKHHTIKDILEREQHKRHGLGDEQPSNLSKPNDVWKQGDKIIDNAPINEKGGSTTNTTGDVPKAKWDV